MPANNRLIYWKTTECMSEASFGYRCFSRIPAKTASGAKRSESPRLRWPGPPRTAPIRGLSVEKATRKRLS